MIRVRPARNDDARAIAEIYVETWRNTYAGLVPDKVLVNMSAATQSVNWTRALDRGREIVLAAEDGEAGLIGFGSCGVNRDRESPYSGEIYTLYVASDHQDRGAGRRLLLGLFDALVSAGHAGALVWVLSQNPSRFFYQNMGGARVGDRIEKIWGVELRETAYGWTDLAAVIAANPPGDAGG